MDRITHRQTKPDELNHDPYEATPGWEPGLAGFVGMFWTQQPG